LLVVLEKLRVRAGVQKWKREDPTPEQGRKHGRGQYSMIDTLWALLASLVGLSFDGSFLLAKYREAWFQLGWQHKD